MRLNSKGFTLLEVLIALVIVSLVFFACTLSLTQMTKNIHVLEEKTIASLVAGNVITQARLGMLTVPAKGKVGSNIMMAKQLWYWSMEKVATDANKISMVDVTVKNSKGTVVYNTKGFVSENS